MDERRDPPVPSMRWRVGFTSLLTATMGVGPLVIHALSTLAPLVLDSLDLTRTEFGTLSLVMFGFAAVVAGTTGSLADRLGPRAVLLLIFGCSGAAIAVASLAPSLAWLWLAAVIVGLAQALSNPVTNQLIASYIPAGRQGVLLGIKQSGVQLSQSVAGLLMPLLAVALGWRGAVATTLVVVGIGLAAVPLVVPSHRGAPRATSKRPKAPLQPLVILMAIYTVFTGMGMQAGVIYLPLYAYEGLGLPLAAAGLTGGVLGATGVVARIGWGRAAERQGSPLTALAVLASGAALSALAIAAGSWLGPVWLWAGAAGFGLTALAINSVTMLAVVRGVPSGAVGRSTGIIVLGLYGGFMVGPIAFGAIVDGTGSYGAAWALVTALFLLAATIVTVRGRRLRA